jgi:hypothetical protein
LCCRKADSNTNALSAGRRLPDFMAMTNIRDQSSAPGAGSQGYYGQQGAFVDYSEAPSRSSSGSSLSSRMPTRPSSGPVSIRGCPLQTATDLQFSRSSRVLGCWGRVARIPVVDRRRRMWDPPGAPVDLLPIRSLKGLVGLQRTRAITRRWTQCASTREVCHGVNCVMVLILLSSFHFYVVLVYFLWLAGLLMDMQWPRLPFIYNFFSLCFFFAFSRRHVLLDGRVRDSSTTSTELFFPLLHVTLYVPCYSNRFYNHPSLAARSVRLYDGIHSGPASSR